MSTHATSAQPTLDVRVRVCAALAYDYELPLRRNQDCADPNDVDC